MALQGTFYGTTANVRITPIIEWSAVQSVSGNYSDITATLSYTKKNSNPTTGGRWTGSITIGEETKTVSSQYIEVYQDKVTQVVTFTARVYHDSYGKATVTISATGGIVNPSSSTLQDTKISAAVTLDTIPRASAISCTKADVGKNPTITITRADASFTHTVSYVFGELKGTVATKTKETTIKNWTIPDSFYSQLPKKSGEGTLTCDTYSGSKKIGSDTCELKVTTDEAVCKPTLTAAVTDSNPETIALTGNENILVRYKSIAQCTYCAEGNNGATVTEVTVNGVKNAKYFPETKTGVFLFRAKDSRDYVTKEEVEKTLVPYVRLTARGTATRTDPVSGNARLYVEGSYFSGSFGAAENALTLQYRPVGEEEYISIEPRLDGNSYTAEAALTGLDYTRSFAYELLVEDKLSRQSLTVTLGKGVPVFDWGETDFNFNVPVTIQGNTVADVVIEQGNDGTWTWTRWASGKAECHQSIAFSTGFTTAWGSLYQSDKELAAQTYPITFASRPTEIVSIIGGGSYAAWIYGMSSGANTNKKSGTYKLCRPTEVSGDKDFYISYHIMGNWK